MDFHGPTENTEQLESLINVKISLIHDLCDN